MTGLIVALDTADLGVARGWAAAVAASAGLVKVGLQLFAARGPEATAVAPAGRVFLDLKLHDIPATVAGAARAAAATGAAMLTVHAAGGPTMVAAARAALDGTATRLLAVTVLTSATASDLWAAGVSCAVPEQVLRLARLALGAGADGLVCAPGEVAMLRDAFGAGPTLVVPGVRPAGAGADDQARVATPRAAAAAGASWVVVGRPITRAADPAAAAAAIAAELAG